MKGQLFFYLFFNIHYITNEKIINKCMIDLQFDDLEVRKDKKKFNEGRWISKKW